MYKTNIKNGFIFVVLFITGCAGSGLNNNETKTSALKVYPNSISSGESIRLTFPQNHPHNMAIRNPSGIWYSIQNSSDNIFILPRKKYEVATGLQLNTLEIEGTTWINGVKVKEKIFQKQGDYLIYMANNLETEPENTFHFMTTVKLIK